MSPDELKEMYRRHVTQPIILRRFTGSGVNRPQFDALVNGSAKNYGAHELLGSIVQGDQRIIVLAEDLINRQFALPLTVNDKVVVNGKELAIMSVGARDALDGTLIAYELQARG